MLDNPINANPKNAHFIPVTASWRNHTSCKIHHHHALILIRTHGNVLLAKYNFDFVWIHSTKIIDSIVLPSRSYLKILVING